MNTKEKREFTGAEEIKIMLRLFLMALIAFFAEFFLFQMRYWTDLGNQEIYVPLNLGSYSEGTLLLGDGSVISNDGSGIIRVTFDLRSLHGQKIRNIAVTAACLDGEENWDSYDGKNYARLQSRMVEGKAVLTRGEENRLVLLGYLGEHAGGKDICSLPFGSNPEMITLQFQGLKGEQIQLSEIRLNVRREMRFSVTRYLVCFFALVLFLLIQPKSDLWKTCLFQKDTRVHRRMLYCGIFSFLVFSAIVFGFIIQNPVYVQGEAGFAPYRELTHALAKGQTWMEEEPPADLLALEDPYDFLQRMESGVRYKLDYALYEGKYYVYFGIVPCLLFFLPLYLIAGIDVPGWIVVALLLILLYAGLGALLKVLAARYYRNMSIAAYLLLRIGMVSVLSLPMMISDPCAYYIPMLSAVTAYVFGICLYMKGAQAADEGKKDRGWIVGGSICMALIAGCRPQLVLAVIAVLPLLAKYFVYRNEKGIEICRKRLGGFALPYIPVALGLMYYNAIRFGSPFDFGASYNLTFANTYNWQFHIEAVGAGIVYYLLRLPRYICDAPYMQMNHLEWSNPGLLANHTSTGGLYMLYPVLWAGLLLLFRKKGDQKETDIELRRIGLLWLGLTVFMAVLTAAAGGLMDRYRMDYAIFASLAYAAAMIGLMGKRVTCRTNMEKTESKWGKMEWLSLLWGIFTIATIITSVLLYFEEGVWWIAEANPEWYSRLAHGIEFWR